MTYDALIIGGGPAGLAAALTLARARKTVLLCDRGPRRNAAAKHLHNFVTRDGTPPAEFRRMGREELSRYPTVHFRDDPVAQISGTRGHFQVSLGGHEVSARRIILCTGMIDEMLPIDGFAEHWGDSIYQCPFCHGYEARDRKWGYLARPEHSAHFVPFALQLKSWTDDVTVYTGGSFDVPEGARAQLKSAGLKVETGAIQALVGKARQLEAVVLSNGGRAPCDALFAHPPQRQVDLVRALQLELDEEGFVKVDAMKRETSIPGIYAAGDLTTRLQAAVVAAAMGMQAAAMANLDLMLALAESGSPA